MSRFRRRHAAWPAIRRGRVEARAFTLVELLVAMSLVTLLLGVLVPTLSNARSTGYAAACLSNQRQLGLATASYSADHEGRLINALIPLANLPVLTDPIKQNTYAFQIRPYLPAADGLRCPSDRSPQWTKPSAYSGRTRLVSYGLNFWTSRYVAPPLQDVTQSGEVPSPAFTVSSGELAEEDYSVFTFASVDWFSELMWSPRRNDPRATFERQIAHERHTGQPTWLFHDGHAAAHTREQLHQGSATSGGIAWTVNRFEPSLAR